MIRSFPRSGYILILLLLLCFSCRQASKNAGGERWPAEKALLWYSDKDWVVGANFIPSTAINQLEMWQENTFDTATISRELAWASGIGMNSMRVFLHNLLWEQDPEGFLGRIDTYLTLAQRQGISTLFVVFDGVWDPEPQLGPQRKPYPRRHNSGWVQSPGNTALLDTSGFPALEGYVKGVMTRFRDDDGILMWDLFNEPDNRSGGLPNKSEVAFRLLKKTFKWAREINPSQPVTAGVWGRWLTGDSISEISLFMLEQSDVISFHFYENPKELKEQIDYLEDSGRPVFCTEYLARGRGNTFESILPVFKEHGIGAYNWGLVDGKTQTKYPWISWDSVFTAEPEPWHHDVFRADGTPYRQAEIDLIRSLTSYTD